MLGWRKRNDGFEWREYVRTTILVRRKHRRDRVSEAGKAAVEQLKAAGQRGAAAGAEGAKAVGRGAVHVGHQGAVIGAAGAKAVGHGALHYGERGAKLGVAGAKAAGAKLRAGLPVARDYLRRFGAALLSALAYTWAVLRTLAAIAVDYLGPLLAPVGRLLRQPSIRLPLLIAGAVALLGGIIRAFANGFERDTWIALLIGLGLLGALALAHGTSRVPAWLSSPAASAAAPTARPLRWYWQQASRADGLRCCRPRPACDAGLVVYPRWRLTTASLTPQERREVARESADGDVEGRGTAVTGDTLRIGSTIVRLNGIEAPEPDQMCTDADGRDWSCGRTARQALAGILRSGRVTCEVSDSSEGYSSGDCEIDDRDIAAELVRGGHVFAATGLFASYRGLEDEARASKAGLWVGQAMRPSDYRAQKWEEAKREAPDGCPIKGNVRGGRRFYVVPWARGYERVRVSASRGERWFCSESEAREAGFKPSEQS
ncbi:MAG: thermonuclease family protein [Hyphomicrobium sp.]|nr:thermonuclease family protein [Hyphomicrobium sp.]